MIDVVKITEDNFFDYDFDEFFHSDPKLSIGEKFIKKYGNAYKNFQSLQKRGEIILASFDEERLYSIPYVAYLIFSINGKYIVLNEVKSLNIEFNTVLEHIQVLINKLKTISNKKFKIIMPLTFISTEIKNYLLILGFKEEHGCFLTYN